MFRCITCINSPRSLTGNYNFIVPERIFLVCLFLRSQVHPVNPGPIDHVFQAILLNLTIHGPVGDRRLPDRCQAFPQRIFLCIGSRELICDSAGTGLSQTGQSHTY